MALNQLVEVRILRSQRSKHRRWAECRCTASPCKPRVKGSTPFRSTSVAREIPCPGSSIGRGTALRPRGLGVRIPRRVRRSRQSSGVDAVPSRRRSPVRIRYGARWKGGRVVHGVVLLRRTGRKAGAGSNPAPSAAPVRYTPVAQRKSNGLRRRVMQVRILSGVQHRSQHNGGWRPAVGNQS